MPKLSFISKPSCVNGITWRLRKLCEMNWEILQVVHLHLNVALKGLHFQVEIFC